MRPPAIPNPSLLQRPGGVGEWEPGIAAAGAACRSRDIGCRRGRGSCSAGIPACCSDRNGGLFAYPCAARSSRSSPLPVRPLGCLPFDTPPRPLLLPPDVAVPEDAIDEDAPVVASLRALPVGGQTFCQQCDCETDEEMTTVVSRSKKNARPGSATIIMNITTPCP